MGQEEGKLCNNPVEYWDMHKNDFEKKDPMYSYVTAITEISKKYQLCQPALLACFPGYAAYFYFTT